MNSKASAGRTRWIVRGGAVAFSLIVVLLVHKALQLQDLDGSVTMQAPGARYVLKPSATENKTPLSSNLRQTSSQKMLPEPSGSQNAASGIASILQDVTQTTAPLSVKQQPWPTLFFLGASSSASWSLFMLLNRHPNVCVAVKLNTTRTLVKEPNFFMKDKFFTQGANAYLSMYGRNRRCQRLAERKEKAFLIDMSTQYLVGPGVPARINQTIPASLHHTLRFVVVLREPVERDRSWQGQKAKRWKRVNTDEEYVAGLKRRLQAMRSGKRTDLADGFYDTHLEQWWQHFPREQFLVLSMETMKANETETLTRIMEHLGLEMGPLEEQLALGHVNADPHKEDVTRLSALQPALCLQLKALYAPHLHHLYALLRRPGLSPSQPPFPPFPDPCPDVTAASAARVEVESDVGLRGNGSNASEPWPTLFYLGVPKSGSSSVFMLLAKHPHACFSHKEHNVRQTVKEPDFFLKHFERGKQLYLQLYSKRDKCERLRRRGLPAHYVDMSVRYFAASRPVAQRLKETIPASLHHTLRFVVVLREPVERDRSWQGQKAKMGDRVNTDEEYVAGLQRRLQAMRSGKRTDLADGFYDTHLEQWWQHFPREQFLVLSMETMKANETETLTRIMEHLGLEMGPLEEQLALGHVNADPHKEDVTRLSALQPALCLQLKALYAPHLHHLYALLRRPGLSPSQPPFPPFPDPCPDVTAAVAQRASGRGGAVAGSRRRRREGQSTLELSPEQQPWPTLFYLGVPKSGSSSVFWLLNQHPQVCVAHRMNSTRHFVKEPDFFLRDNLFNQGPGAYLAMYDRQRRCQDLRARGHRSYYLDMSVQYLFRHDIPSRIKRTIPASLHHTLRFVVVLREPVERDRSWQGQKAKMAKRTTSDAAYVEELQGRLEALEAGKRTDVSDGFYDTHLEAWWREFPRQQFLVLSMETMKANETETLTRIMEHLGLEMGPLEEQLALGHVNADPHKEDVTRLSALQPALCLQLKALYAPHLHHLYALLRRPGLSPSQPPFPPFPDPCSASNVSSTQS